MSIFDRKPLLPARRPSPLLRPASASNELPPGTSMLAQLGILLAQAVFPQPRDRALDINCGPGYVTFPLGMTIGTGGRIVGVDQSADFVTAAKQRTTDATFKHVEFYTMQPDRLEFPASSFNLVTCGMGLTHFQRPDAVLRESHRVLRGGGWLGLTVAHPGGALLDGLAAPASVSPGQPTTLPAVVSPERRDLWSEQAVGALLVANGFAAVHVQVIQRTAVYRTVEEWWKDGALTSDGTPLPLPPGARRDTVPADLALAYRERLRGRFLRVPLTVTVALARRGNMLQ